MSKATKTLERMRNNPAGDWTIEDLKNVARRFGAEWRQQGTSHLVFRFPAGQKLVVPAHKPIKPVYIKQFLATVDEVGKE